MSIDFNATLRTDFSVDALDGWTRQVLADLTAAPATSLSVTLWPDSDAIGPGVPGTQANLDAWKLGPGYPDRWITFEAKPSVFVDCSTATWDVDGEMIAHFEATASWRTASSVVVAISVVMAAVDLGNGEFDSNVDRILGQPVASPTELLERLRLKEPCGDFEEASRQILLRTPGYGDWPVLHLDHHLRQ